MAISGTYFKANDADGVEKKFGATTETVGADQVLIPTRFSAPVAAEVGGCSIFRSLDLDESEEEIKATAGSLYGIVAANASGAIRYLKLYNATAASVTVGTTTPVVTIPLPFATTNIANTSIAFNPPLNFSTAITAAVTTGLADNDTGAPGANDVVLVASYK